MRAGIWHVECGGSSVTYRRRHCSSAVARWSGAPAVWMRHRRLREACLDQVVGKTRAGLLGRVAGMNGPACFKSKLPHILGAQCDPVVVRRDREGARFNGLSLVSARAHWEATHRESCMIKSAWRGCSGEGISTRFRDSYRTRTSFLALQKRCDYAGPP